MVIDADRGGIIERVWHHNGLTCVVALIRQSHRCGYVAISPGQQYHEVGYDEINNHITVHGGLTLADFTFFGPNVDSFWWVGFDCAHYGDSLLGETNNPTGHFWELDEVVEETNKLAEQLNCALKE